jgi:hypothetical protein
MFDMPGTPEEDNALKLCDTDHTPPKKASIEASSIGGGWKL